MLRQAGIAIVRERPRPSMIDPYVSFIEDTLTRYPTLRASRLYQMVRERGYAGSPDHFRHQVALYRPRPSAEAFCDYARSPENRVRSIGRTSAAWPSVEHYAR